MSLFQSAVFILQKFRPSTANRKINSSEIAVMIQSRVGPEIFGLIHFGYIDFTT